MEIAEIYLFDKNKQVIDVIPNEELLQHDQESQLNDLITAEVAGLYRESLENTRFFGAKDVDDNNVFWRYKITEYNKEKKQFYIKGVYELFDDLKSRAIITDKRPQDQGAVAALSTLLTDTGWQVGDVKTSHTASTNWYYATPLEAFWDFIEKWRVEFKPRMTFSNGKVTGKYIDVADKLSDDYGKWYEYGDKLLNVVAEQKSDNIYTAFYGRGKGEEIEDESGDATGGYGRRINFKDVEWGKDKPLEKPKGQEYLEFPDATAEYGFEDGTPRFTVVIFEDIEDEEELLHATYDYGQDEIRPKVQFKAEVLEQKLTELGEMVTIKRDDLDIAYKTRIFKLKRNFLNKKIKEIEFGDKLITSKAKQTKNAERKEKQKDEQYYDWINAIRDEITQSYFNDDGYNYDLHAGNEYDLPGGFYSFDRPIDEKPTKVIYMGAGRLLIANSKKPNGEWDFKTAATGDGVVADVVNAGTLNAELIKAGVLSDRQGNTTLDLENGLMEFKHEDGSYTKIGKSGLERLEDGELKPYHFLTYTQNVSALRTVTTDDRWITLPSRFKGKDFNAWLVPADTYGVINDDKYYNLAMLRLVCFVKQIDKANGRVSVVGYSYHRDIRNNNRYYKPITAVLIVTA